MFLNSIANRVCNARKVMAIMGVLATDVSGCATPRATQEITGAASQKIRHVSRLEENLFLAQASGFCPEEMAIFARNSNNPEAAAQMLADEAIVIGSACTRAKKPCELITANECGGQKSEKCSKRDKCEFLVLKECIAGWREFKEMFIARFSR